MPYTPMYPYNEDTGVGPQDIGDPINLDPLASLKDRPLWSRAKKKRAEQYADALAGEASSTAPLGSPWQAVSQVGKGILAGLEEREIDEDDKARRDMMVKALGGDMSFEEVENLGIQAEDPTIIQVAQNRRAAAAKDNTDDIDEYNLYRQQETAAGREPIGFYDYQTGLKKAGSTNVQTSVQTGENAYAKERAGGEGGFARTANEISTAGRKARDSINTISAMRNTLSDPNFYSGPLVDQVTAFRRIVSTLGGDPTLVTSMESFGALNKQAALDAMGGSLGSGFSNADRDFVTGQVASAENTPQGNLAILDVQEKLQRRKIEISNMARAYEQSNGQIDNGFYDELESWAEANPLFPEAASTPPAPKKPYKIIGVE